jgi:aryl-alcohol dehydrogenase-like predicted oxidoreductase
MQYRTLGNSGVRVSAVSVGTVTFGDNPAGIGGVDIPAARRILDQSIDSGVNLLDTADVYSSGEAESIVGEILKGRRERLLVATKVRLPTGPGPNDAGLSRHHIIASCEASLRRLGVDHIDLYQMHAWDGLTPVEETLSALDALVQQGKVRYLGCSNFSAWHLMKAVAASEARGLERFVSHQIYYSLIGREAEYGLIPAGIDQGVGTLVWSPLAGGLLSGKYRRDMEAPAGSRLAMDWHEPPVRDWKFVYDVIDVLVSIAEGRGATCAQVALAYLMGKPGVASVIVGVKSPTQLADNLAAADIVLTAQERDALDLVSALPLIYPYWHQRRLMGDFSSEADRSLLSQPHWNGPI